MRTAMLGPLLITSSTKRQVRPTFKSVRPSAVIGIGLPWVGDTSELPTLASNATASENP